MMPLWTMATRSVACGCAFDSVGAPCVAQRVWPMPACAGERLGVQPRFEVDELSFRAAAGELPMFKRRDAGGIVAAIFEPLQCIDDLRRDRPRPENPDDPAHRLFLLADVSAQLRRKRPEAAEIKSNCRL